MADKNLELALKISANASGAEAAVQDTVSELEKLRREAEKPLKQIAAVEKMRQGLEGFNDGMVKSLSQMRKEREELNRLESALQAAGVDTKNLAGEKARLEQKALGAARGVVDLKDRLAEMRDASRAAAAETRRAGDAAGHAGEQASLGALGMQKLAAGFRLLGAVEMARQFIAANASMESMTLAMTNVTGSSEAAAREMAFVRTEAGRLGIDLNSAANSYVQLAASAKGTSLEGAKTRGIWSAVAESMARLGKSSADTDGALLAISQMMSKGVVSAEELRGQLGERLPGAFQAAARAMGTTTQGLGEMLQNGEVIAADFLPKFAAELRKLGSGGDINSFNAQLSRLKNSFTELFTAIGDTGIFTALGFILRKTGELIALPAKSLDLLTKAFTDTREQATLAAKSLKAAWAALFGLKTASEDAGVALAKTGEEGGKAGDRIKEAIDPLPGTIKKISDVVKGLSDDLKFLGVDPAGIDAQLGLAEDRYVAAFTRIARSSAASSESVFQGLIAAVDKVAGRDGLGKLRAAYYDAFSAGKINADQFAVGLDAINTKTRGLWKSMTDTALAEQKRLEDGLKASNDRKTQIEADFAKRRAALSAKPEAEMDFGDLFVLQARARELGAQAGHATGAEAKRLADEAQAAAQRAADLVARLNQQGGLSDIEASGALKEIEGIAVKSAEALKNVPLTVDTQAAEAQAMQFHQAMQQFLRDNPLRIQVVADTGAPSDTAAVVRDAAMKRGAR